MAIRKADRERLKRAAHGIKAANQEREDAIVDAWTHGASIREITEATGMSNAGIGGILERRKVRKRLSREEAREIQRAWFRGDVDRM